MNDEEKMCFCADRSIAPVIARKSGSGKWQLFGISRVLGMGSAEFDLPVSLDKFDEVIPLNSFAGRSYVGLRKAAKWGLLEIRDNATLECEWSMISDFSYDRLEDVLEEKLIDRKDYR